MRASGVFAPGDLSGTEAQVSRALSEAGLPTTAARAWLSSAAGRLQSEAQWSLDYDADLQVASFEVWKDGHLVFGLDDWFPCPRPLD